MKQNMARSFARVREIFLAFTPGQKFVAIIGSAALVLAAVMVFRWAATPDYAPLYSNLAAKDASAIVDQLDSQGVTYKLANSGGTIMVPKDQVYSTRIALSGKGLPGNSDGGYSLLDNQSLSTSQFQEQTDFKRAMEGELARTLEAIDGVDTAIVHLALPPTKVFADEQDPPTAAVLIDTTAGTTFGPEQVQAVVNLVSSSIDGLAPENVTVTDAQGQVLTTGGGVTGIGASGRDQQVNEFQTQTASRIQTMLDRVLGPGNSTVQVTADLDFDKSVSESTTYSNDPSYVPLSKSSSSETYNGPAGSSLAGGVVGPDGQMDPTTTTSTTTGTNGSKYIKKSATEDNGVDNTIEHRETAPGAVNSLHVAVVMDQAATKNVNPTDIANLVKAGVGINTKRGDTVQVTPLLFDRTADLAAAAELAAAAKADAKGQQMTLYRNVGIAVLVLLMLLLAWLRGRRRNKARQNATTYVVEQLRQESLERTTAQTSVDTSPALAALERAEASQGDQMRHELSALVERQPEDVAALLRGWLVEHP